MNQLPPITEAEFMGQVIDLARLCGWRVAHFRPARTAQGWRTAVTADGAGWPDLVLVHAGRGRVLVREVKTDQGKLTSEQRQWLTALSVAGADAGVWRPCDWEEIERTLRGDGA